jgi:hypothetical protein
LAKAAGAEFWVELLPINHDGQDSHRALYTEGFEKELKRFKKETGAVGVETYFPRELFKGMGGVANEETWHDSGHLGTKGHAVYAKYLAGQIIKQSAKWKSIANVPTVP